MMEGPMLAACKLSFVAALLPSLQTTFRVEQKRTVAPPLSLILSQF